jgi:hypothetical protein
MVDRRLTGQLLISVATTLLAIALGVPPLRRVPLEYALPLLLSGVLLGTSLVRAELALRQSRRGPGR